MFDGRWRSACGAEIDLVQHDEAIVGTYTANDVGVTVPCRGRVLIGTAEGDIIGFVTSCSEPHMVSSWIGRLVHPERSEKAELHTVRHAVDRLSQHLEMARSLSLETVVFHKLARPGQSNAADLL